eukprot:TRINITY_DN777989_c0_g1_i1.p1 TRINITY_DN777989_c0_g1~~TRINITY_DN777989_c0_g1_i1.p1  ORF type:complete len:235 (-),score=52.29 TRINITY_DN777989_c0_g1_i1:127-831(-)
MPPKIATLSSMRDDAEKASNASNDYYVGGADGKGGGSGLAVMGRPEDAKPSSEPLKACVIRSYPNGFRVNDGPLRSKDDPQGMAFMRALKAGRIPRELENGDDALDVSYLEEKEPYEEESLFNKFTAFIGLGKSTGTTEPTMGSPQADGIVPKAMVVNESKEKCSVFVRTQMGKRIEITMNCDHTIGDLYGAVAHETGVTSFSLKEGFPPKTLEPEQSISESGVIGSLISQFKV